MGDKEKEGEGDGGIQSSEPGKCIFIKRHFDYDVYTLRIPMHKIPDSKNGFLQ